MRRRFIQKYSNDVIDVNNYLTIEALQDGLTVALSVNTCEYCIDEDGNWESLIAGTTTKSINAGHTLSFRGQLIPNSSNGIGTFTVNKYFNLKGNVLSMLFGDGGKYNYGLSGRNYAFYKLFYNCTTLKSISANFLPSTTLSNSCYQYMFFGCTNLTTAPELPATTLSSKCYLSMFADCTNLTTAPELPATTLASNCYENMFDSCTSLVTAPELPATILDSRCYSYMFSGCSKLNYIKAMFITTPSSSYTINWVVGVASSGTFVKNKNASWNETGVNGIPRGWTVVYDGEDSGESILTFPVTLVEGDNGEIGISVYQYMLAKGTSEVQLSDKEVIYITHNNKTEIASYFMYCDGSVTNGSLGYIEAPLQEGYYVILYENGHVDTWN